MADENTDQKEIETAAEPAEEENADAVAEAEAPAEEVKEVPAEFKALIEQVEKMSVLELHQLVKALESHFGVSAAAVAVAAGGGAGDGEGAEEQTSFTVELTDAGAQKIAIIKAVKEVLGLGLKEAKELVDSAPAALKEGVNKEDAEALKAKIEEAGGKATLK